MSSTVSTLGQTQQLIQSIQNTQKSIGELNEQIGSGLRGTTYGDFGPRDSRISLDLRPIVDRIDVQVRNIQQSKGQTDLAELTLGRISEIAQETAELIVTELGATRPNTAIIREQARQALTELGTLLNTRYGDRQLFAGSEVQTEPVDVASLDALVTYLRGETDPNTYAADEASIIAAAEAITRERTTSAATVPAGFAAFGSDIFSAAVVDPANDIPVSIRVDDDTSVTIYGVPSYDAAGVSQELETPNLRADAFQFREIIRGLAIAATLDYPEGLPADDVSSFRNLANYSLQTLRSAKAVLDNQIGILGNTAAGIRDTGERLQQAQTSLTLALGSAEDVDVAEAISRLQLAQTQLSATFNVTASLRSLTIVNFL